MERKLTFKEKQLLKFKEQKKKATKHVFITLGIVIVLLTALIILRNPVQAQVTKDQDNVFTASFVGNMNFTGNVEKVAQAHGYSYLFENVKPYLSSSDYVTGNVGQPVANQKAIQALQNANFTLLNGANEVSYVEKNGVKIANLAFTDPSEGKSKVSTMLPLIKEAKTRANLVFVYMDWGKEYSSEPSPRMKDLAKAMSEAGADVIIGNNTHVLSSVDVYQNTVILYGLGNFISDEGWTKTRDSVLAQYQVNNAGQVKVELVPLRMRDSRPEQIGTMGWFHKQKILKELTKYSTNPQGWTIENNKLVFKFQKF